MTLTPDHFDNQSAELLRTGLRPEAEEEAQFVCQYAACLGVPCVRERADVRGMARSRGISIEEAARDARQALFLKWAAG